MDARSGILFGGRVGEVEKADYFLGRRGDDYFFEGPAFEGWSQGLKHRISKLILQFKYNPTSAQIHRQYNRLMGIYISALSYIVLVVLLPLKVRLVDLIIDYFCFFAGSFPEQCMHIVFFVVEITVINAEVAGHVLLPLLDHQLFSSVDEEVVIVDHSLGAFCRLHRVVLLVVQRHKDGYALQRSPVLVLACIETANQCIFGLQDQHEVLVPIYFYVEISLLMLPEVVDKLGAPYRLSYLFLDGLQQELFLLLPSVQEISSEDVPLGNVDTVFHRLQLFAVLLQALAQVLVSSLFCLELGYQSAAIHVWLAFLVDLAEGSLQADDGFAQSRDFLHEFSIFGLQFFCFCYFFGEAAHVPMVFFLHLHMFLQALLKQPDLFAQLRILVHHLLLHFSLSLELMVQPFILILQDMARSVSLHLLPVFILRSPDIHAPVVTLQSFYLTLSLLQFECQEVDIVLQLCNVDIFHSVLVDPISTDVGVGFPLFS